VCSDRTRMSAAPGPVAPMSNRAPSSA
jgi:hypothetical protein